MKETFKTISQNKILEFLVPSNVHFNIPKILCSHSSGSQSILNDYFDSFSKELSWILNKIQMKVFRSFDFELIVTVRICSDSSTILTDFVLCFNQILI